MTPGRRVSSIRGIVGAAILIRLSVSTAVFSSIGDVSASLGVRF